MAIKKYKSFLVIIMVVFVSFGCIPSGNNDDQDTEYKIQVSWFPMDENKHDKPTTKEKSEMIFTIPEPEKKFRIMEENMGEFGRIIIKFCEGF